jgi:hypothetical protein
MVVYGKGLQCAVSHAPRGHADDESTAVCAS